MLNLPFYTGRLDTAFIRGFSTKIRATYGKQIISTLAQKLAETYGKGWSEKQLRHFVHFAETFPNLEIVSALGRQLSWTHINPDVSG